MLNDRVLGRMSELQKTSYAKMAENYWQASDDYEAARNDTEWCLINNCSVDDAHKYKSIALNVMQDFEERVRALYGQPF